jgi:enoyl-CoA hydratase/carnithine racemase
VGEAAFGYAAGALASRIVQCLRRSAERGRGLRVEETMSYQGYECLRIVVEAGVAWVTIDHPPINLLDLSLIGEMVRVGAQLEADPEVRVVVLDSADPEFFIAHADVNLIQALPDAPDTPPGTLGLFHAMVDRFRTMPKATIAKITGRCRGGGSELVLSMDMRFAALETAVLAQPEVSVGIIPGGSGTQRLPRLVGRGRAMEIVLGCLDYPAALAERYGYVNRAMPRKELDEFVPALARRIAGYPAHAIALAKQGVLLADGDVHEGMRREEALFFESARDAQAKSLMTAFLDAGGQTRDGELTLDALGVISPPAKG